MIDLTCPITDIAPLVPHSGKMILLDRVVDFGDDFLVAEAEIRDDNILLKENKLPAFLGAEIMAQGVVNAFVPANRLVWDIGLAPANLAFIKPILPWAASYAFK